MLQKYAYKYRIYPTEKQKIYLEKHFGCNRLLWNKALEKSIIQYENEKTRPEGKELYNEIVTKGKENEYPFLAEVSSTSFTYTIKNLNTAYKNFFREGKKNGYKPKEKPRKNPSFGCLNIQGHPQFKSKDDKQSYQLGYKNYNIRVGENKDDSYIIPEKFLGEYKKGNIDSDKIKIITHRNPPENASPRTITISKDPSGRYSASILYQWETDSEQRYPDYVPSDKIIGIDMGLTDFVITSEGDKLNLNKKILDTNDHKTRLERKRSKKYLENGKEKSNHYIKLNKQINKINRNIVDLREQNHYDIIIHDIIEKYKPVSICVENLGIKNMMKNKKLSRAIGLRGWFAFLTRLEHKCKERGIHFVKVGKTFASSKICSCCGEKNDKINNLSIRKWECPRCNTIHDRDINSAINVKEEGIRILKEKNVL